MYRRRPDEVPFLVSLEVRASEITDESCRSPRGREERHLRSTEGHLFRPGAFATLGWIRRARVPAEEFDASSDLSPPQPDLYASSWSGTTRRSHPGARRSSRRRQVDSGLPQSMIDAVASRWFVAGRSARRPGPSGLLCRDVGRRGHHPGADVRCRDRARNDHPPGRQTCLTRRAASECSTGSVIHEKGPWVLLSWGPVLPRRRWHATLDPPAVPSTPPRTLVRKPGAQPSRRLITP